MNMKDEFLDKIQSAPQVIGVEEKSEIFDDTKLNDALNFYCAMLGAVKDVFGGDKITEAVIVQAVEAASYGVWCSIMGSKYSDEPTEPRKAGRKLTQADRR